MKKLYLPLSILVAAVMLLGVIGCSAAPSELKPCTVSLGYVSNEWAGEEVIAANVLLTVKNPNTVSVYLDSLDYKLLANDTEIGMKTMVPRVLIPASGSVDIPSTIIVDYSASLAVQKIYIGQGKDYVTAHVMAASMWKLLGGKKPPLWNYPALGIYAGLKSGPAAADAAAADPATIVGLYAKLRGTIDAVQGGLDKAWDAAKAGPCMYKAVGKATISYGSMTKDTAFDLKYERP
jgi:LEA14-like dessication related protein